MILSESVKIIAKSNRHKSQLHYCKKFRFFNKFLLDYVNFCHFQQDWLVFAENITLHSKNITMYVIEKEKTKTSRFMSVRFRCT